MFDVTPNFTDKTLAFILAWIPVLIWLRPRIGLLNIKQINRYYFLFFFQLLAAFLMEFCAYHSQKLLYIELHGYKTVSALDETGKFENTDYFKIKNYYLDTSIHPAFRTVFDNDSIKDSAELQIFICSPMYKNAKDTANHLADYWLGIEYTKIISNQISREYVPDLLKRFDEECQPKFQKDIRKNISYFERIDSKSFFSEAYDDAANKVDYDVTGADRIFFTPHYVSHETLAGIAIAKISFAFILAIGVWILAVAFIPFRETEQQETEDENDLLPYPEKENHVKKFFSFLIPKENYVVTPWLVYINAFCFVAMLCSFTGFFYFPNYILYNYGGNIGVYTINGHEYWRLITAAFLHDGIFHFVGNMFFLIIIGKYIEQILGRWKYIILYAVALIAASLVSAYYNWYNVGIGASGAIMGLYGAFYVFVFARKIPIKISRLFIWTVGLYLLIFVFIMDYFPSE